MLLHTKTIVVVPAIYCYAWRKTFDEIPTIDEMNNEYIMPLGWFTEQFFPDRSRLTYIGNHNLYEALKDIDPAKLYDKWRPATLSVAKEAHLTEEYPLNLCEKLCDTIQKANKNK